MKEAGQKEYIHMIPFYENSQKCKLTYSKRKKINDCLQMGGGLRQGVAEGGIAKGHEEIFGEMDMFIILIIVMVS